MTLRSGLAFVFLCSVVVSADVRGGQQSPPVAQFRTGVDFARIDVTVLDSRTHKPMSGLRAEDFVLKIAGRAQPVETLAEVDAGARPSRVDSTARRDGSGADVTTNAPIRGRLFVIVMDDAITFRDPFPAMMAKRLGHTVVDQLAPDDRAAVVFAQDNSGAVGFTDDRQALHRAVESYTPHPPPPTMDVVLSNAVLERTRLFLDKLPDRRRAVVWITGGTLLDKVAALKLRLIGGVPVYTYSTRGLVARLPDPTAMRVADDLRVLADQSGGQVFLDTNDPTAYVPAMFDELSSYYALGFPSTGIKDYAWIDIEVRKPHAQVVPSGFAYATSYASDRASTASRAEAAGVAAGAPARGPSHLLDAIGAPLPVGDIPLRLAIAPVATDADASALVLTAGFTPPAQVTGAGAYRLQLLVFNGEGDKEVFRKQQDIGMNRAGPGEVVLRVPLPRGRYYLRLSFEHVASGVAGSVFAPNVVVPDFKKEPLSMSGIVVGRAEGGTIGGRDAIADLLPFAPTSIRTFASTDHVGAMTRIYQRAGKPASAVTIETSFLDDSGATVVMSTHHAAAAEFAKGAKEYRTEMPLSQLRPGAYLMRVKASSGSEQSQREVRFVVL